MNREAFWRRRSRTLRRRVNLGWWLAGWWPVALAISLAGSLALVLSRRLEVPLTRFFVVFAAVQVVAGLVVWLRARRRFFRDGDALVHLDTALALDCRLVAAHAGAGDYPTPSERVVPLRWRWPLLVAPVALAVLAIAVAANVPIARSASQHVTAEPPPEWQEMETWLEMVEETKLAEPEALQTWEERLASLREQPRDEWYDHGSLEASDTLRDDLAGALRSLATGLESAEGDLAALSAPTEGTGIAAATGQRMENALSIAARGGLPLSRELAEKLRESGLAGARALSPEELARLRRRLREGAEQCRSALVECPAGHRLCPGRDCRRGSGAIARGPGPAPLTLMFERSYAGSEGLEAVNNPNVGDAAIGDLVGVERGQHVVDEGSYAGVARGGQAGAEGRGGEAVWRNPVTPEEREVLERYFK